MNMKGKILYCHTDLRMSINGARKFTQGKKYKVEDTTPTSLILTNDNRENHYVSKDSRDGDSYLKWFKVSSD